MMSRKFEFFCPTISDTQHLAAKIGAILKGGEVLEFHSDLGGGKTTFVKGLARGMGITEVVHSPTFTLCQIYTAHKGLELHHYDFYRLTEAGIMSAELSESLAQPNTVVAVEWGEIVHDILPKHRLTILIKVDDHTEGRKITITCPASEEYISSKLEELQK